MQRSGWRLLDRLAYAPTMSLDTWRFAYRDRAVPKRALKLATE